jgi:hypothetical protein
MCSTTGPAEFPQLTGCPMIVVDRLVNGVGVDLAGTVTVDRDRDVFDEFTQPRLVIAVHGFPGGPALGLRSHSETIPTIGAVSSR